MLLRVSCDRFSAEGNRLEVPGRQPQGPPDRPLVRRRDARPKAGTRCAQDIASLAVLGMPVVPRKYAVTRVDKNFESGDASSPGFDLRFTDPSSCQHPVEELLCFRGLCSSLPPSPRRLDQLTCGSCDSRRTPELATHLLASHSNLVPKLRGQTFLAVPISFHFRKLLPPRACPLPSPRPRSSVHSMTSLA